MASEHIKRAGNAANNAPLRPATQAHYHRQPPEEADALGTQTWITRAANFVVAISKVVAGSALVRDDHPDEYMLILTPGAGATVAAGLVRTVSPGDALFIIPPGRSTVTATAKGVIARVFSNRATDLCAQSANVSTYADGAPEIVPLVPWPTPIGGFKLRHYPLENYREPQTFGRLFRSTNLMINAFEPITVPRDTRSLSPHSHADFEQGSLSLSGTVFHHLRTPWTPDMSAWRPDEHVEFKSPALLVIPANLIHTTRYTGGGPNWFFDIFSPPRIDFSEKPGWVRNAGEYPMPD
ncbi:MAG: hypothetical protein EXR39_12105 [Betaproteobacteria bacterium]|nr:hypothetical protein [Betaproteobacteria bacterium]